MSTLKKMRPRITAKRGKRSLTGASRTFARAASSASPGNKYRHLTDRRRQLRTGLLEVPCAGTVVAKVFLDGRVEILPSRGGEHERIVDDWQHPRCRPLSV
jgi:hypothetical protein